MRGEDAAADGIQFRGGDAGPDRCGSAVQSHADNFTDRPQFFELCLVRIDIRDYFVTGTARGPAPLSQTGLQFGLLYTEKPIL